MKNKYWIMFLFLMLIGCFYWFEIRPMEIRKKCVNSSMPDASISKDLYWNSYKFCLADNGLKE